MKDIKNIVFDFGGVLIDWNPIYLYGKEFKDKEEMDYFLNNICTSEWNIQQDAGRSLKEATEILQAQFPDYHDKIQMFYGRWEEMLGGLFDENVKLIKPLKEKYNLYGLTNWSAETIPVAMERYSFFEDLDGIVVSGTEKLVKPDKELYRILIDRYQINADETLFIDDNYHNIQVAEELGFQTIHLTQDVNLEEKMKELMLI